MPTVPPLNPESFGDLPTSAYIGDTGIVFGDVDAEGIGWGWSGTNPWGPKPSPREEVGDRSFADGQWDASRFYGPRAWSIPGFVKAPDHVALHRAEQRLRDAIGVTPFQLRITEPGYDGFAMARQQSEILWTEVSHRYATFSIGLYAPDPLIYSSLERSFTMRFPTRTGGLEWPTEWPATWTGSYADGRVDVLNPGTRPVPLQLVLTGPVDNFRIANTTTGEALLINNPDDATLTAGQFMTIDTGRHSALLLGTASRRSWTSGDWPLVPPGVSTFAITGDNTTDDSNVVGTYRGVRL